MRQHFADDAGAESPIYTNPPGALMRYAVGKTVHEFLHTMTMTPLISQEYGSGTEAWRPLDCGRFSDRLSVIANAEWHEYIEMPT